MKVVPVLLLGVLAVEGHAQESTTLKLTQTVPLPGVNGRFDHFAVDVKGRRLFVAALGNNTLAVLDLEAAKHVRSLTGLQKPTGVLFLAEANQIGVANGDDGSFKRFDAASYALLNHLPSLDDADNMRFDPAAKCIYSL
jgi:DNA-binding beta-propeller fold protein YncE